MIIYFLLLFSDLDYKIVIPMSGMKLMMCSMFLFQVYLYICKTFKSGFSLPENVFNSRRLFTLEIDRIPHETHDSFTLVRAIVKT